MRVEQRIGRIDRLGQVHPEIVVRNYFYRDTVEAEIYRRLADRIGFFQEIVGPLQPILHRLGETVKKLAMVPEAARRRPLEEDLDGPREIARRGRPRSARRRLQPRASAGRKGVEPAVSPAELKALFLGSQALGRLFSPDEELPGAYELRWRGLRHRVTFAPELFAQVPLQAAPPHLGPAALRRAARRGPAAGGGRGARRHRPLFLPPALPVGLFLTPRVRSPAWPRSKGRPIGARKAKGVDRRARKAKPPRSSREPAAGSSKASPGSRPDGAWPKRRALVGGARRLLAEAALVELARAQNPGMFDLPLDYGFGEEAIVGPGAAERKTSPCWSRWRRKAACPPPAPRIRIS